MDWLTVLLVAVIVIPASLVLAMVSVVATGLRRNRREIRRLQRQAWELRRAVQTPEEKAAEDDLEREVEDQKRRIHGIYCTDGC